MVIDQTVNYNFLKSIWAFFSSPTNIINWHLREIANFRLTTFRLITYHDMPKKLSSLNCFKAMNVLNDFQRFYSFSHQVLKGNKELLLLPNHFLIAQLPHWISNRFLPLGFIMLFFFGYWIFIISNALTCFSFFLVLWLLSSHLRALWNKHYETEVQNKSSPTFTWFVALMIMALLLIELTV